MSTEAVRAFPTGGFGRVRMLMAEDTSKFRAGGEEEISRRKTAGIPLDLLRSAK